MDTNQIMLQVMPMVKTFLMLGIGLGGCIGLGYYLFIVKRRRVWNVNLWEQKGDGRIHLVGKDALIEKKINKGKQVVYLLKKYKKEVFPPPHESVYRLFGKEYADYLRIRDEDFQPMKKEIVFNIPKKQKVKWLETARQKLKEIRFMSKEEVQEKFIHIPINNVLKADMKYEIMDYDINMMRINAIDNRDKIYADTQDWLQKYGTYLAMGMIVVLIIVVLYLSYDYSANVIGAAMGKAESTLNMVESLASKLGGASPPS